MTDHGRVKSAHKKRRASVLSDAGSIVGDYIDAQRDALHDGGAALRIGDEAVIHATRVATRRLRSTMRVFARLFDPERATHLDVELQWWAALLGEVRDRQVLQRRLDRMVDDVDDALLMGPVKARIDDELHRQRTEHWAVLQSALASDRYRALLDDVDEWADQPPLTMRARRPGPDLVHLAHRADRKVIRRLSTANRTGDVDDLHRARKAAKRARYAAEAASPIAGKRAAKETKRYERLQDLLGEHQDSIVSAQLLRHLGAVAGITEGENGFAFGLLYERERQRAERARKQARRIAKHFRS
jgi:CHAD domain-containing protein